MILFKAKSDKIVFDQYINFKQKSIGGIRC